MSLDSKSGSITSVLQETRVFPPAPEFARTAHVSSLQDYEALWNRAKDDPEGFWGEQAVQLLAWIKPWERVLDWKPPFARWFVGGELNAAYNCVDRHCEGADKNKAAIIWEGEPGERRVLRYQDLLREVCKFANILKSLGVKKGDVVAIYLPMIPELVIATLACARLAHRTWSCSEDSAPRPSPGVCKTARPGCWSPPMAAIAGATSCRSRKMPMEPRPSARLLRI